MNIYKYEYMYVCMYVDGTLGTSPYLAAWPRKSH